MSRLSGTKRKVTASVPTDASDINGAIDPMMAAIEQKIQAEMVSIKNGTHPSLQQTMVSLQLAKDKKIEAADRHRKMQIKNINALYEYEVEDASSLMKKAYSELQDELVEDLLSERNRQRMVQAELHSIMQLKAAEAEATATTTATGVVDSKNAAPAGASHRVAAAAAAAAAATTGTGTGTETGGTKEGGGRSMRSKSSSGTTALEGESNNNSSGSSGGSGGGSRTTAGAFNTSAAASSTGRSSQSQNAYSREYRSGPSVAAAAAAAASNNTNNNNGNNNGSGSGGKKRSLNGSAPSLEYALPESSMRSDFLDIVRDLHSRAQAFEASRPKKLDKEVKLSGDLSELTIGDDRFNIGDMVVVFSSLSQENISGIITALTHKDLVVRMGTGVRFCILIGQIRSGRVTLSKDKEMIDNAKIFRAAADMASVRDKIYK